MSLLNPRRVLGIFSRIAIVLMILSSASSAMAKGSVKVVATIPDLAAIAAEVGGEHVVVASMASANEDPHFVDAKPSHIVKLNKADLLILNGLELEVGWLPGLIERARNARINPGATGYFDASIVASPLGNSVRTDRSAGDVHPGGNPHFLLDPKRVAKIAIALGERLAKIDSGNGEVYRARALAFSKRLNTFADAQAARFAKIPEARRKIITYHDSTIYLTQWLGLKEVIQVEPKPGIAPNPKHLARVLGAMREQGCRVILQESYYPRKSSAKLAELGKANFITFSGGASYNTKRGYEARLVKITDALHAALTEK